MLPAFVDLPPCPYVFGCRAVFMAPTSMKKLFQVFEGTVQVSLKLVSGGLSLVSTKFFILFVLWKSLWMSKTKIVCVHFCQLNVSTQLFIIGGERLRILKSKFDNVKISRNFMGWFMNFYSLHHSIKAASSSKEYILIDLITWCDPAAIPIR